MEALIKYCGERKVFKGARPTNIRDCFRRYALMLRYKASSFASNRRSNGPDVADKGKNTRGMVFERDLSKNFWERLCDKSAKGDNTLASVEKFFSNKTGTHFCLLLFTVASNITPLINFCLLHDSQEQTLSCN
jgi:hypothetical protein